MCDEERGAADPRNRVAPAVHHPDGSVEVRTPRWRMTVAADGLTALLRSARRSPRPTATGGRARPHGRHRRDTGGRARRWHTRGRPTGMVLPRRSTAWQEAMTRWCVPTRDRRLSWEVRGTGVLRDVLPLAVRAAFGGRGGGLRPSGHAWRPCSAPIRGLPDDSCAVGGERGHRRGGRRPPRPGNWFFTPAPLCLALTEDPFPDTPTRARPWPLSWWTVRPVPR